MDEGVWVAKAAEDMDVANERRGRWDISDCGSRRATTLIAACQRPPQSSTNVSVQA
jgi:hypothetical protein